MFQVVDPTIKEVTAMNFEEVTTQIWEFMEYPKNHPMLPNVSKSHFWEMMEMWASYPVIGMNNEVDEGASEMSDFSQEILELTQELQEEVNEATDKERAIFRMKRELAMKVANLQIIWIMTHYIKPQYLLATMYETYTLAERDEEELKKYLVPEVIATAKDESIPILGPLGMWQYRMGILHRWTMQLQNMGMIDDIQMRNNYMTPDSEQKLAFALALQELAEMEALANPLAKQMREMGNTDLEIFKGLGVDIYKEYLKLPQTAYPMDEIRARAFHYQNDKILQIS